MTHRNPGLLASVLSTPFVLCVLVLAAAGLGQAALVQWLDIATRKEAIPLRKPLGAMDKARLGDYQYEGKISLSAAVEDALGTDQYLEWSLTDTSVKRRTDPRRYVHLSVTYYTGGPNLVPHTPDLCRVGGGYQPKQAHENRVIDVPSFGEGHGEVPIRVCTFVKTAIFNRDEPTVIYTFHTNGEFKATRTGVRHSTHRVRDRYAYFSKVEVSFGGVRCQPRNLGREESVTAATKLFDTVLPILIEEHWPDWEAVRDSSPAERG